MKRILSWGSLSTVNALGGDSHFIDIKKLVSQNHLLTTVNPELITVNVSLITVNETRYLLRLITVNVMRSASYLCSRPPLYDFSADTPYEALCITDYSVPLYENTAPLVIY